MVLNLDKCIGCQTCTVTCKNVWTTRRGMEYAWFNNVETKPGTGYPTMWEDQKKYSGGWRLDGDRLKLRQGGRAETLAGIFANIHLPSMKDYYEPFTFNYSHLKNGSYRTPPTARPYSLLTGKLMEKVEKGPNWEDDLGGTFATRAKDPSLDDIDTRGMEEFERSFMFYLPRLCEHCLNPACVAACPSGAIYKRDEDGIVLIDENKCRGWRECVSACPYKKIYFNWQRKRSEKCIFCYPRIENGVTTVCSETCVGRIRYVGVMLYDEDRIQEYASAKDPKTLYEAQLALFLDPEDPEVARAALAGGISQKIIDAAIDSPVRKLISRWKVAFPLHPEYRTLPMQWYMPPLSPVVSTEADKADTIPTAEQMRIPVKYIANMLTAGNEQPVRRALERLVALRLIRRARRLGQTPDPALYSMTGVGEEEFESMYRLLAIANYEDRFVIPTERVDKAESPFAIRSQIGFPKPRGKVNPTNLFGGM